MLRRAIARGLVADARKLATHNLALPLRDGRALTALGPCVTRVTAPGASSPVVDVLCVRAYATAQPTRRKAAGSSQRKPATPRAKKTVTKAKKRKPAKKVAAKKKKPVVRKKKAPTELELKKAKVRDLKKKALLESPKQLPQTAYLVYMTEQATKGTSAATQAKENAIKYKNLPASEVEHFQNVAQQNRRANERTIKNWIESHSPDEIRLANNARRQLNKISKEPKPAGALRALVGRSVNLLSDERAPVKYDSPFIAFTRARWASGDFANVRASEAAKMLGKEWKELNANDAKRFRDDSAADKAKYEQAYDRVFTRDKARKSAS